MRCFVYCRVSTEEQSREDHYSLQYQEESVRRRIEEKEWQLYRVRKDVGSARAPNTGKAIRSYWMLSRAKKLTPMLVGFAVDAELAD